MREAWESVFLPGMEAMHGGGYTSRVMSDLHCRGWGRTGSVPISRRVGRRHLMCGFPATSVPTTGGSEATTNGLQVFPYLSCVLF